MEWLPLPSRIFLCRPKTKIKVTKSHLLNLEYILGGRFEKKNQKNRGYPFQVAEGYRGSCHLKKKQKKNTNLKMPSNSNLQNMLCSPFSFFINKKSGKVPEIVKFRLYFTEDRIFWSLSYDYLPYKVKKKQIWYFGRFLDFCMKRYYESCWIRW